MIKRKQKQKYYNIPSETERLAVIVASRLILQTPDDKVPPEVLEDIAYRLKHLKYIPACTN
jgi:hypothetical protein